MSTIMNFYLFLFIAILPVIDIGWIVLNAGRLKGCISEMPWLNEIDITSNGKIIFPKKLESMILKNADNKAKEIHGLVRYYKKLVYGFILYWAFIIILVVVVALKIIKIAGLFHKNSDVLNMIEITEDTASIVAGILILLGFYLQPLLENRKSKVFKFVGWTGGKLWSLVRWTIDKLEPLFIDLCEVIYSFLISWIMLNVYLKILDKMFVSGKNDVDFVICFMELFIYQYVILGLVAYIIHKFLCEIKKKVAILTKCCNIKLIYKYVKNCTYLTLIYINASEIEKGRSSAAIVGAIGILFLLDDYMNKRNNIKNEYRGNSKNEKHE